MEALVESLKSLPMLVITVLIQYRLPKRMLGLKFSGAPTFFIMVIIQFLAGWVNLYMSLVRDIGGNALYYGIITLGLYLLLFKDSLIKKIFIAVMISCGLPITFYVFLPFAHHLFQHPSGEFYFALDAIQHIYILISAIGMEYMGKKFQNLRHELPFGYTVYLTGVMLFVYVAIYSAYNQMFISNRGVVSLASALTMSAFAVAGAAIVVIAIFAVDRQVTLSLKEQLRNLQEESFKTRELEWRRFSGFRHDIKNHLICLSGLLENEKKEQAVSYMENLTHTVKKFDSPVETGNDYANALLSVKYAVAVASGIEISIDMSIPEDGYIEPVDLCSILSNAFDNAIAACYRITEGKKWITARGFIKQGQFVISIKNSKPQDVTVVDGDVFPKEITSDHGLGLDTVKGIVEKYNGVLSLSAEEVFSFSVMIPQNRL